MSDKPQPVRDSKGVPWCSLRKCPYWIFGVGMSGRKDMCREANCLVHSFSMCVPQVQLDEAVLILLPLTEDGVSAVPGMELWSVLRQGTEPCRVDVTGIDLVGGYVYILVENRPLYKDEKLYSTYDVAKKENEKETP